MLEMELGGSSTYSLSCQRSAVAVPTPETDPSEAPSEALPSDTPTESPSAEPSGSKAETGNEENNTVAGIPITHLILFISGLVLSIGCLVGLRITRNRRTHAAFYDDDTDDDDDDPYDI